MTIYIKSNMRWISLFFVILSIAPMHAETWFVYRGMDESGSGQSWDQAKKSIEEAVHISLPGDTILVGYASVVPTIYLINQGLTLDRPLKIRSARFGLDNGYHEAVSDSSLCILDAQNTCRPVLFNPQPALSGMFPEYTEFIGFTLKRGNATHENIQPGCGGAICIMGKASPLISHCLICDNSASKAAFSKGYGGGICCIGDSTSLTLRDNVICNNLASELEAGFGGGLAVLDGASVNITFSKINDNRATLSLNQTGEGGGIYGHGQKTMAAISNCLIQKNNSASESNGIGGGICGAGGVYLKITMCDIDSNLASQNSLISAGTGGGICCHDDSTEAVIENTTITRNVASESSHGYGGGIAILYGASGQFVKNKIIENMASSSQIHPGRGGGIFCRGSSASTDMSLLTIQRNVAALHSEGYGGGICIADSAKPTIISCTIDSNTATKNSTVFMGFGGGFCIYGDSAQPAIKQSIITNNIASEQTMGYGGGIAFIENASGILSDNQIMKNTASSSLNQSGSGGGIYCSGTATRPLLLNNIIDENQAATGARGFGGALGIFNGAVPEIKENTIQSNIASVDKGGFGGGIVCGGSETYPLIEKNQIQGNTASVNASGFGGGIYFYDGASSLCGGNQLIANHASLSSLDLGLGGGICIENESDQTMRINIEENHFERNVANRNGHGRGGALAMAGSGVIQSPVRYNLFLDNLATASKEAFGLGGAIFLSGDNLQPVIRNNNLFNNLEDSTSHPEGHGSGLCLYGSLPDTSIRNNLWRTDADINTDGLTLYATLPCTITNNAFFGYPAKYNDLVTSHFEVDAEPMIDKNSMIPAMSSPLVDAGFDPVIHMDDRHSGWFVDIGIVEFTGTLVTKKVYPEKESLFAGQVRAGLKQNTFTESLNITMQVNLQNIHPQAFHSMPRWYRIQCNPDIKGNGELVLSYTDEELYALDEYTLRLWHFNVKKNQWDGPFFTQRDTVQNWIQAPFTELSGDWVITDARDMNALPVSGCAITAGATYDGILLKWSIEPRLNIVSATVWRSEDGEHFLELEGSGININPDNGLQDYTYLDNTAQINRQYYYKIQMTYFNGRTEFSVIISETMLPMPEKSVLFQNFPNPFNQETQIHFLLSKPEHTTLEIRDTRGQLVKTLSDKYCTPGAYTLSWNGTDASQIPVPSGVYFFRLKTASYEKTGKMLMLR